MLKILFVDDEQNILNSMRRLLRFAKDKIEVIFIRGGEEALQDLKENRYDVLVSDMNMPEINGQQLAAAAKSLYPEIRVIILTGLATPELRQDRNVDSILSKPCGIDELIDAVGTAE